MNIFVIYMYIYNRLVDSFVLLGIEYRQVFLFFSQKKLQFIFKIKKVLEIVVTGFIFIIKVST